MAVREILQIGDPILRKRSLPIGRFDDALAELAQDMIETMHEANGVGLAAPQIGVLARLIVVEMPDNDDYPNPGERFVLCNPKVVKVSRETEVGQEGCLSVRGYVGMVERPIAAIVEGQDLKGAKVRIKAQDYLVRAFLHEIDHLDGVLYVDLAEEGTVMTVEALELLEGEEAEEEQVGM
ncbi:MAG: peptide deformylase [Anaerolineae bacterium]|nr:peptide deformylase [Anaerolineae bacterium]